jgi:hypothetical protein
MDALIGTRDISAEAPDEATLFNQPGRGTLEAIQFLRHYFTAIGAQYSQCGLRQ